MKAIKGHYFPYGIHIPDMKYLSRDCSIETMPPPEVAAISLSQSIGAPAVPCVAVGDKVLAGQKIASAGGFVSSNIFASISGEVTAIEERANELGGNETYIFIKREGDETATLPVLSNPSADEIKKRVAEAGIVGMGGAGFPTHIKLSPKTSVDTLLLNGAECEPYLNCDYRIMIERTEEIANGARLLAKALGVKNILIGIETNKPDVIAAFEKYDDIQPIALKKQYPMGSEKHLIYVCTKRKVPLGKLPADVGCVVENVATCLAAYEAVNLGKPLYERVMTVSGNAIAQPKNITVRVGTPFTDIAAFCGSAKESLVKIVRGGPMTGASIIGNTGYTKKATGGLIYMDKSETDALEPSPCLSCGKCADVCPMRLMPMQTTLYAEAHDYERAARLGGAAYCIECGSCVFICPAKRPLLQNVRKVKAELRKANEVKK